MMIGIIAGAGVGYIMYVNANHDKVTPVEVAKDTTQSYVDTGGRQKSNSLLGKCTAANSNVVNCKQ